jgi:hypothetical protein
MLAPFNFPVWGQRDLRWKDEKIGGSSSTLGGFGCAVACIAMQDAGYDPSNPWTPDRVNKWFTLHGGYAGTYKNLVIWGMIEKLLPNSDYQGADWTVSTPAPIQKIKDHIAGGGSAVVEVAFHGVPFDAQGRPVNRHYLLVVGYDDASGALIFNDPWYADRSTFASRRYGSGHDAEDILTTHYFRDAIPNQKAPQVAPPPVVPVSAATPAPATPPPPAEVPAPPALPVIVPITPSPKPVEPESAPTPEPAAVGATDPEPIKPVPAKVLVQRLDRPRAVEVDRDVAVLCDINSGKPVGLVPSSKRFTITHFAVRGGRYYVLTERGAGLDNPEGIDPEELRRVSAPSVDTIPKNIDEDELGRPVSEILTIEQLPSKIERAGALALHALFADWHMFKFPFGKKKVEDKQEETQ